MIHCVGVCLPTGSRGDNYSWRDSINEIPRELSASADNFSIPPPSRHNYILCLMKTLLTGATVADKKIKSSSSPFSLSLCVCFSPAHISCAPPVLLIMTACADLMANQGCCAANNCYHVQAERFLSFSRA